MNTEIMKCEGCECEDENKMCEICGEKSEFCNPYNDMDLCEICWNQDLDTEKEKRNEWYREHENDEVYQEYPDSMEDDLSEYLKTVFKYDNCEDCGEKKELAEDRICHRCYHSSVPKGECWCDPN